MRRAEAWRRVEREGRGEKGLGLEEESVQESDRGTTENRGHEGVRK